MRALTFVHEGHSVRIEKNAPDHPETYLWLYRGEERFFLGVLVPGMTRGDVKRLALKHPALTGASESRRAAAR